MINRLKSLDIYRKMPSDLTESTHSGAIISILATLIMLVLFITEILGYLAIVQNSQMYVDTLRGQDKMKVSFDLQFHACPCDLLVLSAQDAMESASTGQLFGVLVQTRIDKNGKEIEKIKSKYQQVSQPFGIYHQYDINLQSSDDIQFMNFERVSEGFKNNQGCRISGYVKLNRVPGFILISSKPLYRQLYRIYAENRIRAVDFSHNINTFYFGEKFENDLIQQKFSGGVNNPLENYKNQVQFNPDRPQNTVFAYYLSVIPTTYLELNGKESFLYQFTSIPNIVNSQEPVVFFRYDLSPVTVQYYLEREPFLHFIVEICAIIGGVFTVAQFFDSLIHKSVTHYLKKAESGKL